MKRDLASFGFPNPIIYPASSRQGLLAKLIQQGKATESQVKDFKIFFSARYASEEQEGNQIIPAPRKIAPQALEDSGISTIQETVIQTITQNSGWNLLSDVLASFDKAARAIEDTLSTQISGWKIGIEALQEKVEEYRKRSETAKSKVEAVKKSVEEQKQILLSGFSQGISIFSNGAKAKIEAEIDRIAESVSVNKVNKNPQKKVEILPKNVELPSNEVKLGFSIPSWVPFVGGASFTFETKTPLVEAVRRAIPTPFDNHDSDEYKSYDSYIIRVKTKEEAQKIGRTINEFCAPHIQSWWIDIQDKLVRDGTRIREELVQKIQDDIQQISNELSNYLGGALEVKLNINPIQFPSFNFPGIDAKIEDQQEVFKRKKKEERRESRCCSSDKVYYVDVEYEDRCVFYEVDLRETAQAIKLKIDEQVSRNRELLKRVIEKQVSEDFRSAEQQINNYIKSFEDEFDRLLRERETREAEADQIRAMLEEQKVRLNEYLGKLAFIRESLDAWKPV